MEIDKNKVYIINNYTFTNYICLSDNLVRQVLEWRNHEDVRRWMYNSDVIPYKSHIGYVESLRTREDAFYWLVSYKGEPVGCLSLTHVDPISNSAELGFYYRPDRSDHSLFGVDYVYSLYYFVFNILHFGLIRGGILNKNKDSLSLSLFMGAKITGELEQDSKIYLQTEISCEMFNSKSSDYFTPKEYIKYIRTLL